MKKIRFIAICILSAITIVGCSKKEEKVQNNTLVYRIKAEAGSIDPQFIFSETGITVGNIFMEGLTRFGKNKNEIIPGVAEKWEVTEDGLSWTFYLKKNLKWSNGTPLTAKDFYFAWKRALNPKTGAPTAGLLYYIKNAEIFNQEKINDFTEVGINVIDDYTLKVNLRTPCTYFPQLTATAVTFPLNEEFYSTVKEEYALAPDKMLYNGPWILTKYLTGQGGYYEFEKNKNYWNNKEIKLDKITVKIIEDENTAANLFINNDINATTLLPDLLPKFIKSPTLKNDIHFVPKDGVNYMVMNLNNKFFRNKKIRKAIALAIDRKTLTDKLEKNNSRPSYGLVPATTMYNKNANFREKYSTALFNEDIEQAKTLLSEGLKEIDEEKMDAKLLVSNNPKDEKIALFIQEQLRSNLGINIILEPTTQKNKVQKIVLKNYDFTLSGWGPDYNDPMAFLEMWTSRHPYNYSDWSNDNYDKLIKNAIATPENKIRMDKMAEAEKILIDNMVIIPLFDNSIIYLIQSNTKGIVFGLNAIPSFLWTYIQN